MSYNSSASNVRKNYFANINKDVALWILGMIVTLFFVNVYGPSYFAADEKGAIVGITASEGRTFNLNERATIEAGSDEPFELWNEKSRTRKISIAVTDKQKFPLGWDHDDYYMIEKFETQGEWKVKQGEGVLIRFIGSPNFMILPDKSTVIKDRIFLNFMTIAIYLWLTWIMNYITKSNY